MSEFNADQIGSEKDCWALQAIYSIDRFSFSLLQCNRFPMLYRSEVTP